MSSRVNLLAPEFRANPYPIYAELRRNAPASQVEPGGLLGRHPLRGRPAGLEEPAALHLRGPAGDNRPAWLAD